MAANWRGGSNGSPQRKPSAPTLPQAKRAPVGWRRHSGKEATKAGNRVWLRRVSGIVAVVILAGALVALYLRLKPVRPEFIVDIGAYDSELVTPGATAGFTAAELQKALPNLSVRSLRSDDSPPSGRRSDASIVFVDAVMLSGANGPFIADDRSRPDDTNLRLQPLKAEANRPKSAKEWLAPILDRAKARPTLLVLDFSQPRVNWRAGVLAPFATAQFLDELRREADRQLKSASTTKLAVLVSCRPGEQAWSEDGRSRFSRSVVEALNGAADGAADGKTDGRVTASELGRYVCNDVEIWVSSHRFAEGQHPVWMMFGSDFDIAYASGEAVRWPAAPTDGSALLNKLVAAWQLRDGVWSGEKATLAYEQSPLDWRRANHLLLQAEACFRAGQFKQANALLVAANASLARLTKPEPPSFDPPTAASAQLAAFEQALPDTVSAAELQQSVEVRAAAHRAATASPLALGLIRETLLQADAARREAEDALFIGDIETVRQRRSEASQRYQDCLAVAEQYRRAVHAVDRLLAGVPALADWAAAQPISDHLVDVFAVTPAESGDVDLSDEGVDGAASLLIEARSLRLALSELEDGTIPVEDAARKLVDVASQAEDAVRRMEKLVSSLQEDSKRLLESADKTGGRRLTLRRQLEQNLANCLLSADTRRSILVALADLDRGLNTSAVGTSEGELPARDPSDSDNFEWKPGETSQELAKLAAWQGLWALLVRSLDPSADSDSENLWTNKWAVLADQARLGESERPFDAETAVNSASSLGDLLRIGWKASAAETGRVRYFSGETDQVTRELVRRDRIARCLPGFDADALIRSNRRDPALDLAAWSDSQLSLFLARQSLDDFYANEAAGSRWFEEACRFHINSANGSSLSASAISTAVSKEVSAAQDLLSRRRSSRFWVQTDRVTFGSYDRRPALLGVSTEGDPPAGSMAVWLETSKSQSAVQLASPERSDVKVSPSDTTQLTSISIDLLRNVPSCDAVSLPARLFYRGHTSSEARDVDVNPCPPAQRVAAALPEPERGSVIVSGTDRRSVLFVLDCSRSMMDALPDGTSKMFTAKAILQKTVAKLQGEAGPSPRRIGLVAFGHRMNRKPNGDLWENSKWPADDLPTDPLVDYQTLVPLRGAAAADPMLFPRQLNRIDSWGMTPLVNSLRFSLSQFQSDEPGLLVVITDGADSALEKGSAALKANTRAILKGLSTTLEQRKEQGFPIEVHIVGFALDATSKDLLKEVFDGVATPSGGRQFAADDGNKLETFLSDAIEPRKYSVVAVGRNDGPKFDLGMASTELGRGEYRLIFPDAEPAPLKISGGERIVFDLRDANLVPRKYQWGSAAGQIARASGAATDPDSPNALVDRGYQIESGQATILLSLDRVPADANPPSVTSEGFVKRPQEIWFDVTDSSGRRVTDVSWQVAEQYDIPTWKLSLPAPSDQKLNVAAHWKSKTTPPSPRLILSRTDIGKEVTISTKAGSISLVLKSIARDEQNPGLVVARFEPSGGSIPSEDLRAPLEGSWAQIEPGPPGAGEFRPIEAQTKRTFFFEEGALEFAFSVGPDFDVASARLGLIEPTSREDGAAVATLQYAKAD